MNAVAIAPSRLPVVLIEAFADGPFRGNGAAVVLLQTPAPEAWMQQLARSLRQSETAFLLRWQGQWLLRWFTPSCEVPLCGHATLAALLALCHWRAVEPGSAFHFLSRSGPLPVQLAADGELHGSLELPGGGLVTAPVPAALAELLAELLNADVQGFWRSALGYSVALLPETVDLAAPLSLAPRLEGELRAGLVLMQAVPPNAPLPRVAGEPPDYQLRFFAPGLGIDEDPVTGSAHALVAPWWMERLGRSRLVGWQCSDRPGGMVCEAGSSGMIRLIGTGHLLWDGSLLAAPPHSLAGCSDDNDPTSATLGSWAALLAAP